VVGSGRGRRGGRSPMGVSVGPEGVGLLREARPLQPRQPWVHRGVSRGVRPVGILKSGGGWFSSGGLSRSGTLPHGRGADVVGTGVPGLEFGDENAMRGGRCGAVPNPTPTLPEGVGRELCPCVPRVKQRGSIHSPTVPSCHSFRLSSLLVSPAGESEQFPRPGPCSCFHAPPHGAPSTASVMRSQSIVNCIPLSCHTPGTCSTSRFER